MARRTFNKAAQPRPGVNEIHMYCTHAYEGQKAAVAAFVEKYGSAHINAKDGWGNTALINAAMGQALQVTTYLLEKGAKVDIKNNDGETALMAAVVEGNIDVVKLLLNAGASVGQRNDMGETPLSLAEEFEYDDIAELLRDAKKTSRQKKADGRKNQAIDKETAAQAEAQLQQAKQFKVKIILRKRKP